MSSSFTLFVGRFLIALNGGNPTAPKLSNGISMGEITRNGICRKYPNDIHVYPHYLYNLLNELNNVFVV